jgi:hypothetical protein
VQGAPLPRQAVTQAAAPAATVTGDISGRVTWDDDYIYFALQVDDADVIGTNINPLSKPQEDDSVAVYFQTGDARPDAPNADTNAMLVSPRAVYTFLQGDNAM